MSDTKIDEDRFWNYAHSIEEAMGNIFSSLAILKSGNPGLSVLYQHELELAVSRMKELIENPAELPLGILKDWICRSEECGDDDIPF